MGQLIVRPNTFKSAISGRSSWSTVGGGSLGSNLGDGSSSTGMIGTSSQNNGGNWDIPTVSLSSTVSINSISIVVTGKYSAGYSPEPLANGPLSVVLTDGVDNSLPSGVGGRSFLFTTTTQTVTVKTVTAKTNGQPFTLADLNSSNVYIKVLKEPCPVDITVYDVWLIIDYAQPGTLTGNTGTVNDTATPEYSFTFSSPDSEYVGGYEAKLFEFADTQHGSFNWKTAPALWSSGFIQTAQYSQLLTFTLRPDYIHNNGTKYRMVARALPRNSSTAWSNTANTDRTVDIRSSIQPRLSVTTQEQQKRFQLDVFREDNILTEDQSIFTSGLDGWAALVGSPSVSWVTSTGYPNIANKKVLSMSYTGSSDYEIACGANASTPYNGAGSTAPFLCTAGEWYSFAWRFWTIGTTGVEYRSVRLEIRWYDENESFISQGVGNTFRTIGGTWVYPSVTAKAPTGATHFAILAHMSGATGSSEFHIIDVVDVHRGNVNVFVNPTFDKDLDGDAFPDDWTPHASGSGVSADVEIDSYPAGLFAGEQCLKISKPTSSQRTEDGIRQILYFAKSSVNTVTAYFYSEHAAIVRVYASSFTGSTFVEATLSPGITTPVSLTGTQSSSTMTNTVTICVRNGWSGGDVYVGFAQAEPKPVDNNISIGIVPTTLGRNRLSNFSPGGVTLVSTELQFSDDQGITWQSVFDQGEDGYIPIDEVQMAQEDHIVAFDYLQKLNSEIWYRARQFFETTDATTGAPLTKSSQWSEIVKSNELDPMTVGVMLKSTTDASVNQVLSNALSRVKKTIQKKRVVRHPLKSEKAIVISGPRRAVSMPFSFYCRTQEEAQAIRDLLDRDETMLLHMPKWSAFVNLNGDYDEDEFSNVRTVDSDDTVINGTFQEVRGPSR